MATGYISSNSTMTADQLATQNPVALPTPRVQQLQELRELPRALMGGSKAMVAGKQRFTPQHPRENSESYDLRLKCTTLFGGYSRGVKNQSGKLFMKPVTVSDAGLDIQEFINNVDGQGQTITAFSSNTSEESFVDGISYLLVDFPTIAAGSTQADQNAIGARPYWVLVRACQVLGWRSENYAGQQILTQFRFTEEVEEETDAFGVNCVRQIRVLYRGGVYEVYRWLADSTGKMDWRLYEYGGASWLEIPVIPFYTNRSGFFEGVPPLQELAELNLEHWVSSSEQKRCLSYLRFAMLALIGVPKGTSVDVGPDKVFTLPLGASASYVEPTGTGIEAGRQDLEAIERRMQSVGMELKVENAGQVTATAAIIDSSESNAALKAVAQGFTAALNQALLVTAQFLASPSPGVARVYDEFAEENEGTTIDFISLYTAGIVSVETVWDALVARHVLDEDFDPEIEKQRLQQAQDQQLQQLQGQALALQEQQQQGVPQ